MAEPRVRTLDNETTQDTLEGITDLHEMIAEVVRSALADQAMAAGLKLRLDEMKSRLARLEERGCKKRQLALDALVEADIKKLMQPDLTVSVRIGTQALVVTSEDNIPEDFWIPQPPKLDRQGVLAALKSGKIIDGTALAYIEGWRAISEVNRIFGFDAWDREMIAEKCVWSGKAGQYFACAYTAKVRINVRAGKSVVTREGSGSGEAKGLTSGQAHDMALKAAETDATKRALSTFGNPFGLALYDKEFAGVRGGHRFLDEPGLESPPIWLLRSESGEVIETFSSDKAFADALGDRIRTAGTIEGLFDLWEHNVGLLGNLAQGVKTNGREISAQ